MGFFSKENKKDKKLQVGDDLDDKLEFDFSEFDEFTEPETKKRKPIERVASGIKDSVKSKLTNPGTYKQLLLNALPSEYTEVDNALTTNYEKLSTTFSNAANDLKPEIGKISAKVDKLIPENQKILRKLYDKTLGKHKEEESSSSQPVDVQQEQINRTLQDIFNKQQAVDLAKESKENAKESVTEKVEHNRFLTNFNVFSSMDANLSALRNYQDNITQAYQKKTLELQYRSYFAQAETLRSLKEHFSAVRTENKSIIFNTSLPDFAKSTKYEKIRDVFQTKFGEKLHGAMFGNKLVQNLTKTLTEKINAVVGSVKTGVAAMDMTGGMDIDKYEMAGGFAGDQISDWVRDKGSKKIKGMIDKNPELAKKVAAKGKKASNMVIGNTDAYIQRASEKYLKQDYLKDSGFMMFVKGFLSDVISGATSSVDTTLEKSTGVNDLYKPSVFTDKAHKSITDVIPGYLSKILREITVLRTGDTSTPTQLYDFQSSKFKTSTAIAAGYKEKILKDINGSTASSRIKDITEEVGKDNPEEVKKELGSFFTDITTKTMVYDKEGITKSDSYQKLSKDAKKVVDEYLDKIESDESDKADFESKLVKIKNSYTDPRADLETGIRYGHGEILENLGLIQQNKSGLYDLNMDKYKQLNTVDKTTAENSFGSESQLSPNKEIGVTQQILQMPPEPKAVAQQAPKVQQQPKAATQEVPKALQQLKAMVQQILQTLQRPKTTTKQAPKVQQQPQAATKYTKQGPTAVYLIDDNITKFTVAIKDTLAPFFNQKEDTKEEAPKENHYSKIIDSVDTNFQTLFGKLDELIKKVTEIKLTKLNVTMPKIDFSGLKGASVELYEFLSKYEVPDEVKQKFIDAVASGKATVDDIKKQAAASYKKANKRLRDITLGDITKKAFGAGKWAMKKAHKAAKVYGSTSKALLGKTVGVATKLGKAGLDFAKENKDPVFNAMSKMFVSLTEFSKKAADAAKDFITDKIPKGLDTIKNLATKVNTFLMSTDIYVKGETEPRLQARLLRNGFYRLKENGKAIYTFKDITGTIIDNEGNVVLSSEDIRKGLVDKEGKPLATPFEKLISFTKDALTNGVQNLKSAAANIFSKLPIPGALGKNKRLDNMITILSQIRDILVFKFQVSSSMVPALGLSLHDLGGKGPTDSKMLDKVKEKGTKAFANIKETFSKIFGKKEDGTSPISNVVETTKAKGFDLLNGAKKMADFVTGKEADEKNAKEAPKEETPKKKGKIGTLLSKMPGAKLIAGAKTKGMGLLAGAKNMLTKSSDEKKTQEEEKPKYTAGNTPVSAGIENIKARKGSATQRLAQIEADNKQRHTFKTAEAKSRYTGEGIFGMLGKMFDFVKGIMSVSGLGSLLTGVLGKIPVLGKLLGTATNALKGAVGLGGKAAGGAVKAAGGAAKGGIMRSVGKGILKAGGGMLKVGGMAIGANLALDALGAPEWVGNAVSAGLLVNSVAGLFGSSLGGVTVAAGSGLLAAGSAILTGAAAIICSPVVLGTLLVAGTAYGAYKLYKHFTKNDLDEYQKIRYQQYGFNLDNKTHTDKLSYIKELEDYLLQDGIIIANGEVSLGNKIDTKKFFEIVDIDPVKNKDAANKFMGWFVSRFKPFFLKHCLAIYKANPKYKLFSIDKLTPQEKLVYLSAISEDLDGPYNYTDAPFKEMDDLINSKDIVKVYIEKLIVTVKESVKKASTAAKGAADVKKQLDAKALNDQKLQQQQNKAIDAKLEKEKADKAKLNANAAAAQTKAPEATKPTDVIKPSSDGSLKDLPVNSKANVGIAEGDGAKNNAADSGDKPLIPISKELRLATGPLRDGSGAKPYITVADKNVNIDAIDPALKKNLMGMVEEYGELTNKKVIFTDGFRTYEQQAALKAKYPDKAASPGKSMHEFGLAFDMDSKNLNEMDSLGLMRKYGFTRPVGQEPWHTEAIGTQLDIGRAKTDPAYRETAIASSLYKGGGGYGTMSDSNKSRRSNDVAMSVLNGTAKEVDPKALLAEKAGGPKAASAAPAQAPAGQATATPTAKPAQAPTTTAPASAAQPAATPASKPVAGGAQAVAPAAAPTPNGAIASKPTTQAATPAKTDTSSTGVTPVAYNKPAQAPAPARASNDRWIRTDSKLPGPTYSDTPAPAAAANIKADKNIVNAIYKAGSESGVEPNKLLTFAAVESDFNPNAKAGTSSAKGLFQFTNSTWNETAKKAGVEGANPTDPYTSSLVASKYIKDNEASLSKVAPQPGIFENYLAHFLGAGGAAKLLKAPEDSVAASILPNAAQANANIFYKNGAAMTVAEVKATIRGKLADKAKAYNIPIKIDGPTAAPAANASSKSAPGSSTSTSTAESKPTTQTTSGSTPTTSSDTGAQTEESKVKRRYRPDISGSLPGNSNNPDVIQTPTADGYAPGAQSSDTTEPVDESKVKRRVRPDLSPMVAMYSSNNAQPESPGPSYSKPSTSFSDPIFTTSKSSTPVNNGAQDNYSKLMSDTLNTSLEYQKAMVNYLQSIDSNISKAIDKVISNVSGDKSKASGDRFPGRQNKEGMETTVDLRRKQA